MKSSSRTTSLLIWYIVITLSLLFFVAPYLGFDLLGKLINAAPSSQHRIRTNPITPNVKNESSAIIERKSQTQEIITSEQKSQETRKSSLEDIEALLRGE